MGMSVEDDSKGVCMSQSLTHSVSSVMFTEGINLALFVCVFS